MYRKVSQCRICGNPHLIPILDLGLQMLTGVFPDSVNPQAATIGPLRLVKCMGEATWLSTVRVFQRFRRNVW